MNDRRRVCGRNDHEGGTYNSQSPSACRQRHALDVGRRVDDCADNYAIGFRDGENCDPGVNGESLREHVPVLKALTYDVFASVGDL